MRETARLMKHPIGLVVLAALSACSTTMHASFTRTGGGAYPKKPANCAIEQFPMGTAPPRAFEVLGNISTYDRGFAVDCGREEAIELLTSTACQVGADAL